MAQTLREAGTGETLAQVTKRPWHRCFPVDFVKFLKGSSYTKILSKYTELLQLKNIFRIF